MDMEQLLAKIMDPDFAIKAARAMDPDPVMQGLVNNPFVTQATPPTQAPFSPEGSFAAMFTPQASEGGQSQPEKPKAEGPKKQTLDPQHMAALQAASPKPVQPHYTSPVAPPGATGRGTANFSPFVAPDMPGAPKRTPPGVSLAQLLYGGR